MKAIIKQIFEPLELTLKLDMIFQVSAIVETDFLHRHLDMDEISNALLGSYSDEQLDEIKADIERHFG